MKLYILLSAPVIGAIEATTIKERILLCEHCNRKELHFSNAILNLDKWNGEEMISAMGQLFMVLTYFNFFPKQSYRIQNVTNGQRFKGSYRGCKLHC